MNLVFLHGPPAAGKLTVGRQLAQLCSFELFHNHLVVDEVLKRHAFGTPAFVAERDQAWRRHLGAAAGDPARRLIFTFNPENSVPQAFVDWLFHGLLQPGDALHSVGLRLSEEAIEDRLAAEDRRGFRKLTDHVHYCELRDAGAFSRPHIPRTDLFVDTETHSAVETSRRIARHFKLA